MAILQIPWYSDNVILQYIIPYLLWSTVSQWCGVFHSPSLLLEFCSLYLDTFVYHFFCVQFLFNFSVLFLYVHWHLSGFLTLSDNLTINLLVSSTPSFSLSLPLSSPEDFLLVCHTPFLTPISYQYLHKTNSLSYYFSRTSMSLYISYILFLSL